MSRYEELTAVRARIRAADDRTVREVLLQLTRIGTSPEAFDRAFEEAAKEIAPVRRKVTSQGLVRKDDQGADRGGPIRIHYASRTRGRGVI